jgi:hypothetical protein
MTHLKFREQLVLSHKENTEVCGVPRGWPSSSKTQMSQLELEHSLHWLAKGKEWHRVCRMKNQTQKTVYCCKCDSGVCVVPCFRL